MKQFHHKTRRGCHQCRRRRIKCDETKPSCRSCTRNHLDCSFELLIPIRPGHPIVDHQSKPPKPGNERGSRLRSTQPAKVVRADAFLSAAPLDLESMGLLHHYTSTACLSVCAKRANHLWQTEMPRMALSHEFLMHGILAFSAVHLSTLQPARSQELRRRAALSEQTAMPAFRRSAGRIHLEPETIHAVFAFAGFIPIYLLAQSGWLDAPIGRIPSLEDDRPHWFNVIRGVVDLLRQSYHEIAKGPFVLLLRRAVGPINLSLNPDDTHLRQLYSLLQPIVASTSADIQDLAVCSEALDELRRVSALPYSPCKTIEPTAPVYIWPGSVSQEFVELLHKRRREALIILAGYCRLFAKRETRNIWYLNGVGAAMIRGIEEELELDWMGWMEWARANPAD